MNLKTLIVEDEKKSQILLKHFLLTYCNAVELVGIADGIEQAMHLISAHSPDLVFLDIELSDGNGFELLEKLNEQNFLLVFVTGYEQFGIKAIKHGAFDYILKPFSILEITNTVDKAKKRLTSFQLLHNLEKDSTNSIKNVDEDRLAIKTATGTKIVHPSTIEYISVDEPYCRINLVDKSTIMVQNSLKGLLPFLPNYLVRVHRSYIVNLNQIARWDKGRGGNIETLSGTMLAISYRLKKSFVEAMKLYTEQIAKRNVNNNSE